MHLNHQDTKTPREEVGEEVDRIAKQIVDAVFHIHSNLGPGLLESVYETCLTHELGNRGIRFERQPALPIMYDGVKIDGGLRLDFLIEKCIIVELKAVEQLLPVHKAQVLTYLKLAGLRLGLLVNFNVTLIRDRIKRIAL
jgi:GxxExxY protein